MFISEGSQVTRVNIVSPDTVRLILPGMSFMRNMALIWLADFLTDACYKYSVN